MPRYMFVYTMPDQYSDSGAKQRMVPLMLRQYYDSELGSYMDPTWIPIWMPIWILYGSLCGSYAHEVT